MPNHIRNRVTLSGDQRAIDELIEKYSTFYPSVPNKSYDGLTVYNGKYKHEFGWLNEETNLFTRNDRTQVEGVPEGFSVDMTKEWTRFPDFDKVKPCPQSVKDVGDSVAHNVIEHVKNKFNTPHSGNPLLALLEANNRLNLSELKEEDMPQFERACKAYQETGYMYWYDWRCDHWGTKWNVYDCNKLSDHQFEFDTAWSGVPEMILAISKQFPSIKIEYKYADEDTGYNCGCYEFESGREQSVYIPEGGSKEAYDIAFELRPNYAENYELVDGQYEYKEDEED